MEEETTQNLARGGFTAQEMMNALVSIAPAMQAAWEKALDDDELWKQRAKRYGWLRTWWLRRQLRKQRKEQ